MKKLGLILLSAVSLTLVGCGDDHDFVGDWKIDGSSTVMTFGDDYVQVEDEKHPSTFEVVEKRGSKYLVVTNEKGRAQDLKIIDEDTLLDSGIGIEMKRQG